MFDRLEDIVKHYEELMFELNNPSVAEDQDVYKRQFPILPISPVR